MRSDRMAPASDTRLVEAKAEAARTASIRFPIWSRRRIVLAVVCALLLPWLPPAREETASRRPRRARGVAGDSIRRLAIRPDGQAIATLDDRGRIKLRRGVDGPSIERVVASGGFGKSLAYSPDGRSLAVGGLGPDVRLFPADGSGPGRPLGIPVRETSRLAYSPDGRALAVCSFASREILIWDTVAARVRMVLRGHASPVYDAVFSPDGRTLASAPTQEPKILIWDLGDGRPEHRIDGMAPYPVAIAYSPDGRFLACSCIVPKSVTIWDVGARREAGRIAGHGFATRSLAFSPDGRMLATAAGDGDASLWSVPDGRELLRLDTRSQVLGCIAFTPDGKTLVAAGNDDDIRIWDVAALIDESDRRD